MHFEEQDDVFFMQVEGVFKSGPETALHVGVILMKHANNGQLYIAYPVMKASLKAQGHHVGHTSVWQTPDHQDGALHLKKAVDEETGQPLKDNAIIEAILKLASQYYARATARHMNLVPLPVFIRHMSTISKKKQGWRVQQILEALSHNEAFITWVDKEPKSDTSLYLPTPPAPQQPPPPQVQPPVVPVQSPDSPPSSSTCPDEDEDEGESGTSMAISETMEHSDEEGDEEGGGESEVVDEEPSVEEEDDERDSRGEDGAPWEAREDGGGVGGDEEGQQATSGHEEEEEEEEEGAHSRPTVNPSGAWSSDGSWGINKRQKVIRHLDIFEGTAWALKMFKFRMWCGETMGLKPSDLDRREEDMKHFTAWLHEAGDGIGSHVEEMGEDLASNPMLHYMVVVPMADGSDKWGFELYMGWSTSYAEMGVEIRKRRMVTAMMVLDWLYWDDKVSEDEAESKELVGEVKMRLGMLMSKIGFTRKHHTGYHQEFTNAFQLSNMIETVGVPKLVEGMERCLKLAQEHEEEGNMDAAKRWRYNAAMWHHDLVKAHLLDFSLPPMTRPLFMMTLQVKVEGELAQRMGDMPPPECHKRDHNGRQQCNRLECNGNYLQLFPDGKVYLYFPHYKNEGKLDPRLHYQLSTKMAGIIWGFVVPAEGGGMSDWQLLTATADNEQDKRFLMGQVRRLGKTDCWRPMSAPNLSTTFWGVVLGAPSGPMKGFEASRVRAHWQKLGLLGGLLPANCQPCPPQRVRNMLASAAIVLMEMGEEQVMTMVKLKQQMDAVLDMVADAMMSGTSSMHHYSAAEGHKKIIRVPGRYLWVSQNRAEKTGALFIVRRHPLRESNDLAGLVWNARAPFS